MLKIPPLTTVNPVNVFVPVRVNVPASRLMILLEPVAIGSLTVMLPAPSK
jgi:hypothetical protein